MIGLNRDGSFSVMERLNTKLTKDHINKSFNLVCQLVNRLYTYLE